MEIGILAGLEVLEGLALTGAGDTSCAVALALTGVNKIVVVVVVAGVVVINCYLWMTLD